MDKNFSPPDTLPGKAASLWIAGTRQTGYPSFSGSITVDAAIVGGGIVGVTAAMLLKQAGLKVALIEAGRIAEGVSGHTTAKVTSAHGLLYDYLLRNFGEERALQYAEANQAAIELVAGLVEEYKIDCDFTRTLACTYGTTPVSADAIQKEVTAASELGLPVFYSDKPPVPFPVTGAICYENQVGFHPRKYLLALAEHIPGDGSHVFENSRVLNVHEATPCEVETASGSVRADHVIMATHFPILDRGLFFAKMVPTRSYLMAAKVKGAIPEGMFFNPEENIRTFRKYTDASGEELLIFGGGHHETGHEANTIERYRQIEAFAQKHFDLDSILYRWSTQDNFPIDRVPFIGRHSMRSKRVYVATGFKGWGLSNGTAAAIILSDMIRDRLNPWTDIFDPLRFTPFVSRKFISRNIHVAKMFMQDYVVGRKEKTREDLARGEGGIIEQDKHEVAAFKDDQGQVHTLSPVCVHLGCKVAWNPAERSWDCPCHGSRYNSEGKVIHGPAIGDLEKK